MVSLFYVIFVSVDLASVETVHAKVVECGISYIITQQSIYKVIV